MHPPVLRQTRTPTQHSPATFGGQICGRYYAAVCTAMASASRIATTSPITTSAGVGASAAAAPIDPSGATITCSSSVVPHETTAAGVDAGLPSATGWSSTVQIRSR
jgi:hypothetical protein